MQLKIEYCNTCNYRPMAASLAMVIRRETGLDSVLSGSRKAGAFEVSLDGALIFSKLETSTFPDQGEIVAALKERITKS